MELAQDLLDLLVCPKSRGALLYFPPGQPGNEGANGFLFCPESLLRYRIDAGIPVMLVEDAVLVDAAERDRLVALAAKRS